MVNQVYLMKTIASPPLPENARCLSTIASNYARALSIWFGAFHRAHQALLTDRVLNEKGGDWGICEISLFSGDRADEPAARAGSSVYRAGERG
jgi:mannitol-1-phosphate/altronate dehydrogenase